MTKPEIGVSMLYCLSKPFKTMTQEIPKTGVHHVEIVDDGLHQLNKRRVSTLRDIGESYNIKYSVHAPFAGTNIALHSKPLLNATLKMLKQSMANAAELNCHLWIFHPGMNTGISAFYPGMDWTRNLQSTRSLLEFARDYGVEISIENGLNFFLMHNVEDFEKFYKDIEENIGLTLDTGHANINAQLNNFLTEIPDKIVHIHAHDNLGKTDEHLGVGYGSIDWQNVAKLLKKAGFSKVVTVEAVEHVEESIQRLKQLFA